MLGAIFYVYKKEVQKMNDLIELKLITREDAECLHKLQIEGKRQTMRLTLNETPLFYERRGFLHSSGSSDDQGIRSSNSAGSIFPCLSQRFGSSVRIYLK